MKRMFKRVNVLQVISLFGILITFIFIVLNITKIATNIFWVFVGIQICGIVMFVHKWSKEGITPYRRLDRNNEKNITRKTSDSLFWLLVSYIFVVCFIFILKMFSSLDYGDYLAIVNLTIVCDLTMLYWVDKTINQVAKIEKSKLK